MNSNTVDDLESGNQHVFLPSDMDFSLLASDMQKFLNISSKNISLDEISSFECNNLSHSDHKKAKTRSGAYLEDFEVYKCPLCPTICNNKDILAKHFLRIHHKAVIALLQESSTQQHLKCFFCVHKVMHRHQKLLLLHLEKKHSVEFVAFLKQSFVTSSLPCKFREGETSESGVVAVNVQKDLKGSSLYHCVGDVLAHEKSDMLDNHEIFSKSKNHVNQSPLCSETVATLVSPLTNPPFAKRKLLLDGTAECRSYKLSFMKENIPPSESLSTTLSGSGWKHAAGKHFACGRCKEAFSCNALLLDHVSVRHRGPLRLLQPLFTCGLCSASFYKNSFLVRHCYQHHTPK